MLFVELALIRWTGENVVYLSYFSNFVLLGSFLGIGIGFLRARAHRDLFPWAPVALCLLVAFVLLFPVKIDRSGGQILYFGEFTPSGLPTWVTLPVLFVAVAVVMTMVAEGVARAFIGFRPLDAYRFDLLGSIAGVVAFSLLAFLRAPPVAWGSVAAVAFVVLYGPAIQGFQIVFLGALVALLLHESTDPSASWSPYYKITTAASNAGEDVFVNGIPHQAIESVAVRRQLEPIYFAPYKELATKRLDNVLVVGAGNGTDVAIALARGASHVDAVEIDPRLYEIGKQLQPDHPYDDPRVTVHIDDGRAFLQRTTSRYDLILFALPDSLTLVSGQSSLRLESYLFTLEAMKQARTRLRPHGVFAMYNYYRQTWLIDRFAGTLTQAYGHRPCLDYVGEGRGLALMTTGIEPSSIRCPRVWRPLTSRVPPPARDDRPFPYLRTPAIPGYYLVTLALILAVSLVTVRVAAGPLGRMGRHLDLFFMGAAFLLLETKNVVQFALLFGTTWFVNALVFLGILVAVLGAVEVARRSPALEPLRLYGLLFASLLASWAVPGARLLALPPVPRFAAAIALAFSPVFAANLVFAQRFRDVDASDVAFGANLLGAMVGGLIEYSALIVGYRALAVVAAGLYGLALASSLYHPLSATRSLSLGRLRPGTRGG